MKGVSLYLLAWTAIVTSTFIKAEEEKGKDKPHIHFENENRFRPVGCFKDKIKKEDRALPVLVKNYRENGELDWHNLKEVILKCAEEVSEKGWVYFGIQFWGECWSGPEAHLTYDIYGKTSTGCFNDTWGLEFSNYVYRLTGIEYECHPNKYKILVDPKRSVSYGMDRKCDFKLSSGWYRFQSEAGTRMPDSCVLENHCNTKFSGWMRSASGKHPDVLQGIQHAEVCFTRGRNCCPKHTKVIIQVRNCGRFYVYKLRGTKACPARYCVTSEQ